MTLPAVREEIPPGTLDMLILKTLQTGTELHGFEIANAIERRTVGRAAQPGTEDRVHHDRGEIGFVF